jgi:hypothetical protein
MLAGSSRQTLGAPAAHFWIGEARKSKTNTIRQLAELIYHILQAFLSSPRARRKYILREICR